MYILPEFFRVILIGILVFLNKIGFGMSYL